MIRGWRTLSPLVAARQATCRILRFSYSLLCMGFAVFELFYVHCSLRPPCVAWHSTREGHPATLSTLLDLAPSLILALHWLPCLPPHAIPLERQAGLYSNRQHRLSLPRTLPHGQCLCCLHTMPAVRHCLLRPVSRVMCGGKLRGHDRGCRHGTSYNADGRKIVRKYL